jgi:hypothetical protein
MIETVNVNHGLNIGEIIQTVSQDLVVLLDAKTVLKLFLFYEK